MSLWTRSNKPKFAPHAVAGKNGWIHPTTNEILESFKTKPTVVTTPTINSVTLYNGFVQASGEPKQDTRTQVRTGDVLTFAVQFNTQVVVTGQPYLTINFNGSPQRAYYKPKSGYDFGQSVSGATGGTATLMFYYKVQSTDSAVAGQVTVTSPLVLNSGTISSLLNTNGATLTFTLPSLTTLAVN
jgi:hypothetical protein